MLHRWFRPFSNKPASMAIAKDGIAFRQAGGQVQMLNNTFDIAAPDTLIDVLNKHAQLLQYQTINLVLSNAFARFVVLPWQAGVTAREDWVALANFAFREQYGAVADTWEIRVNFGAYGDSVVASAIERNLYGALMQSAKQFDFSWGVIEPAMAKLMNQKKYRHVDWTMIVEPNHILLGEKSDGVFQRFSVMTPPTGSESAFVSQMIARRKVRIKKAQQPNRVLVYVSGKLGQDWPKQDQKNDAMATIFDRKEYLTNVQWLASLD